MAEGLYDPHGVEYEMAHKCTGLVTRGSNVKSGKISSDLISDDKAAPLSLHLYCTQIFLC